MSVYESELDGCQYSMLDVPRLRPPGRRTSIRERDVPLFGVDQGLTRSKTGDKQLPPRYWECIRSVSDRQRNAFSSRVASEA